ncbi:MAG: hypothetical protein AB1814_10730 [Thermodesulfobacteriota bacterium]
MEPSFSGARLKIERANQHINELDSSIQRFINTNPYSIIIEKDPNSGNNVLGFDATKPLPREVTATLGDAIHNLRAALDLAVWDAICCAGGTPTRDSCLPFGDTEDSLITAVNKRLKKIASKDICDLIIQGIKPYKGGNDALYGLHRLDIMDKHQKPIITIKVVRLDSVRARDSRNNVIDGCSFLVRGNGVLHAISGLGDLKIESYGKVALQVFFGNGLPYEGEPVIPTLKQLSELVSGIVDKFENLMVALSKP